MMTTEFLTFCTLSNIPLAEQLIEVLNQHEIPFEIEDHTPTFNAILGNDTNIVKEIVIKLRSIDFEKAGNLLNEISEVQLSEVDKDYYLLSFTDEELIEIIMKPDEWSNFDYQLAKKILKSRNQNVNDNMIELLRRQRVQELAKPEQFSTYWRYAGYLFAILGGFMGVMIGFYLVYFKKTLQNGESIYVYDLQERRHGWRMIIIGSIMFVVSLWIKYIP